MAFKILSQSDLEILSEDERKVYEQAYAEYIERKVFVEKLEKMKQVRMPKVSVTKKSIKRVKLPNTSTVNLQGFTVKTTYGDSILNATKKVKANVASNKCIFLLAKYKAKLPPVSVVSPNPISIKADSCYKIKPARDITLAVPVKTRFKRCQLKVTGLNYPDCIKPDVKKVEIQKYMFLNLPGVNVPVSNVAVNPIEPKNIALDHIPIAEPITHDIVISKYKVSGSKKKIVAAPLINYREPTKQKIELCSVPIPKAECLADNVKIVALDIPTPVSVSAPKITVSISQKKMSSLATLVVPKVAPSVSVTTASIHGLDEPTVSIPDTINYKVLECHIVPVSVPSVSVPIVDAVSISQKKTFSLDAVVIPKIAPSMNITTTASVNSDNAPVVLVPNTINYTVPKYSVTSISVPLVSVPVIDEGNELNIILSKIR